MERQMAHWLGLMEMVEEEQPVAVVLGEAVADMVKEAVEVEEGEPWEVGLKDTVVEGVWDWEGEEVGERLGRSPVTYQLGVFRAGGDEAAAQGRFVHVYVTRADQRPVAIPEAVLRVLEGLRVG